MEAPNGGHVYNGWICAIAQKFNGVFAAQKSAFGVDVHHKVVVVKSYILNKASAPNTGIVNTPLTINLLLSKYAMSITNIVTASI